MRFTISPPRRGRRAAPRLDVSSENSDGFRELIALRWRDVDWNASKVRVRQNFVRGEFGTPKSKRSTRSVPMTDRVGGDLERLFKGHHGEDASEHAEELVFADPETRGPMERARVLRRFRAALKAAQLDETHVFHDLRHTFGTRMAAVGMPMRTLQEKMGHRDIRTTERYADYAPNPQEAALVASAFSRDNIRDNMLRETGNSSEPSGSMNTGDIAVPEPA